MPSELTQREGRSFTPEFAAPEQLQAGAVTTATDVYALGVLLYIILSGRHPTRRPEHGPHERQRAVIGDDPPRLSDTVLLLGGSEAAGLRGETPLRLRAFAARRPGQHRRQGLEEGAGRALATATALADDLRRYLAHQPVAARPDSFGYGARKFMRRNRLAVGAALVSVLALGAGIVGTAWQAAEARQQRADALQQRDRARALLSRNEAIIDFIDMMFTEALPAGQAQAIQQMLERSEGLVDNTYASQPVLHAELLRVLSEYYSALNLPAKHAALLVRARELAKGTADISIEAQLACAHAESMSMLGQTEEARQLLERWIKTPNIDPIVAAGCLQARAVMAQNGADSKAALQYAEAGLKKLREAENPPARFEASLLSDIGFAQHLAGATSRPTARTNSPSNACTRSAARKAWMPDA